MTDSALLPDAKKTLQIYGNSLPQLFENAAAELLKTLINPEDVGEALREKVIIEAPDAASLLQEWVNTILRLTSRQRILFKKSRFQVFDAERTGACKLKADITGELIDPQRHVFKKDAAELRCDEVRLLNNSKTIEAQIFLVSEKINLAK